MLFVVHVATLIGIFALLVLGLQLAVGRGQVLFVAPTVFFAIGAYGSALLTTRSDLNPLIAALGATVLAGVAGYLLSFLALRLSGDHLLLATLGTCEIMRSILNGWDAVTGGSIGVLNIPPLIAGLSPTQQLLLIFSMTWISVLLGILFVRRVSASPFGKIHASLHGDEAGTAALGRRVGRTKMLAIAFGAAWSGVAGVLFAHYTSYIDPSSFTVGEAVTIFTMLIVGGLKRPRGALIGATIFVALPELLRFVGIPSQTADPLRRVVCGALLLALVHLNSEGATGLGRNRVGGMAG